MATVAWKLRAGRESDLPALAKLDSSFSNEWVLYLDRHGGAVEQTIELRWRKVRPGGRRRALGADLHDIEAVVDDLRQDFERSQRVVVAEKGRRVIGYLMLGEQWNRTAEVNGIMVDAPYRRRGLGGRFVREAEAFARRRKLRAVHWEAQTDNRDAIEFAISQGFRIAGFNDALYENRGHEQQLAAGFRGLAVFLVKELNPGERR